MKPANFEYRAPTSLADAVALLAELGDRGRPLAGGQSLVPMMNLRLARPEVVVDLNGVAELERHRVDADALVVGATCRHRDIELDPAALGRCAAIADAVPLIGHIGIRNRGTVVGSLAHADPSAEWPCLALLLDAEIVTARQQGGRRIAARDFFTGVFTTALEPGELIVEARFPWVPEDAGSAFVEVSRRHGDFALGAAGAVVALAADGTVQEARLALAGIESVPARVPAAEGILTGREPTPAALSEAAAAGAAGLQPTGDMHAPEDYRRRLGEVLSRRALERAVARIRGGTGLGDEKT